MNIAYFGSPKISAGLLDLLINNQGNDYKIVCVFTNRDKKAGKRLEITQTEVKKLALSQNICVYDLDLNKNQTEVINRIKEHKIDLGLVFAYGARIPENILNSTANGFWNVHPSRLPKYRGPSPIIYPLILGDKTTGVSIIKMTNELDSGPIMAMETLIIGSQTRVQLENSLVDLSAKMLSVLITKILMHEKIDYTVQDEKLATQTRLIKKDDGYVPKELIQKALNNESLSFEELPTLVKDFNKKYPLAEKTDSFSASITLNNYFRGLFPWPGLWTTISIKKGLKRLKIISLMNVSGENFVINQVQIEGKKPVSFKTFNDAYNIFET